MALKLLLVEDNLKLRTALQAGLENTGRVKVIYSTGSGEAALQYCLETARTGDQSDIRKSPNVLYRGGFGPAFYAG